MFLAASALSTMLCQVATAADENAWNGAISGNWSDPARWSPAAVPGALVSSFPIPPATGNAVISATGAPYTVNVDTARHVSSLQLLSPDASLTFALGQNLYTSRLDYLAGSVGNSNIAIDSGGTLGFAGASAPATNLIGQQTIGSTGLLNIGTALSSSGETSPFPFNLRLFMGGSSASPTTLKLPLGTLPAPIAGGGYAIHGSIIFSTSGYADAEINANGGTVLVENSGYINFDGPFNGTLPIGVRGSLWVRSSIYVAGSVNVKDSLVIEGGTVQVVGSAPVMKASSIVSRARDFGGGFMLPAQIRGNLAVDPSGDYMEVSGGRTEFGGKLFGSMIIGADGILAPIATSAGTGVVIDNTLTLFGGSQIEFNLSGPNQSTTLNTDVTSGSTTLRIARDASFTPLPGMRFNSIWTAITDDLFPSAVAGFINATGLAGLRFQAVNSPTSERILDLVVSGRAGDANLDNLVNFDDLLLLAQNYGQPSPKNWLQGDFNFDSVVNFDDLLALAQNYNVPPLTGGSTFESDWALALQLAPEPTSAMLLAMVGVASRRSRHG